MKKFGFTLAEVLITLGIIGVVAAMTTPALVSHGKNEVFANKLAVAVSNFENAMQMAMTQEHVDRLGQTQMFCVQMGGGNGAIRSFYEGMQQYLKVNDISRNGNFQAEYTAHDAGNVFELNNDGSKGDIISADFNGIGGTAINTKSGMLYYIYDRRGDAVRDLTSVYIDVNSYEQPNIVGRDIFMFILGNDGTLYPYGGLDAAQDNFINNRLWNDAEGGDLRCQNNSIGGGYGCAARVIAEGYKINY